MELRTFLANHVSVIKKITGISDFSLWRKRMKKRFGRIWYHKKYTADDVVGVMKSLGMGNGSVVCIHASMMEFYNYRGTTKELITKILDVIGPEGTLAMPAFPPDSDKADYIFNPKSDRTAAGALAECFRQYPGVVRSNNVRHSVCAIGKYADYLTKDHTSGHDCWDKKSPYYRICELNGLIFNLGMPRSYMGTFHHCVESILQYEHPYWSQFFTQKRKYRYYDNAREVACYTNIDSHLRRKTRKKNVTRHFTDKEWRISKISNLEIKVFYGNNALSKMLELGRRGIGVYYIPNPKEYSFN